jgi:crotonobetainyl-CoA:carnitine CoA-transferase CaiB-like acyl-CoA transferase
MIFANQTRMNPRETPLETTQASPKHKSKAAPLAGVRVLSLGGIWAGRVASMLLADQGAEVIEINRPNAEPNLSHALLSRGKCEITLDLNSSEGRQQAIRLALGADIVIENLGTGRGARFGLDHSSLKTRNPTLVYVSIPGFATGSSHQDIPAWEGAVAASLGVYTDIHAQRADVYRTADGFRLWRRSRVDRSIHWFPQSSGNRTGSLHRSPAR